MGKQLRSERTAWFAALGLLLLGYLAAFAVINFIGLPWFLGADTYGDTLVARYMWEQKTVFPEGWVFGNQYYVVATPVLAALFYGLTGSMNFAMALATTAMTAFLLLALWWMLRPFLNGGPAAVRHGQLLCLLFIDDFCGVGRLSPRAFFGEKAAVLQLLAGPVPQLYHRDAEPAADLYHGAAPAGF